ncbi:MAG: hypothetical protein AABX01_07515 [Candidatus Micrarchaeota archaeon]
MRFLPVSIGEIEEKMGRSVAFSKKQLLRLNAFQKTTGKRALSILSSNFNSLSKFMGFEKYSAADQFFFDFVSLPPLGKEYWFLHFTDPNSKKQLVVTFGRAQSQMDINRLKIKGNVDLKGMECAAVIWLFDGKKKVLLNSREYIKLEKGSEQNSLGFSSKSTNFDFHGKYPSYEMDFKGGKNQFALKITKSRKGKPFEILNSFSPTIGMGLVNLFFDFEGKMLGKPFSGKCYVQKVILTSPFIPWNWGRFYFEDGGIFEFFAVYTPILPGKLKLFTHAHYFDYHTNKTHNYPDVNIEKTPDGLHWHVFGDKYSLYAKSYSSHPFTFKGHGEFKYLEYFAEAVDLMVNGKVRGKGAGILEDAVGFVV